MSGIRIHVGPATSPESIRELLNRNPDAFLDAIDLDIRHLARKARVGAPMITDVVPGPDNSLTLHYQFGWSAFQACQDRHDSGCVKSSVRGTIIDGWLELPSAIRLSERNTLDEF